MLKTLSISYIFIALGQGLPQFPPFIPNLVPSDIGSTAKGIGNLASGSTHEMEEAADLGCRPGFRGSPGNEMGTSMLDCHEKLKGPQGTETKECIRLCQWQYYKYVDAEGKLNRTAIERSLEPVYHEPNRLAYVDDFEACFIETKPKLVIENGCKENQAFTTCWKGKTSKACGRPSASAAPSDAAAVPVASAQPAPAGTITVAAPSVTVAAPSIPAAVAPEAAPAITAQPQAVPAATPPVATAAVAAPPTDTAAPAAG